MALQGTKCARCHNEASNEVSHSRPGIPPTPPRLTGSFLSVANIVVSSRTTPILVRLPKLLQDVLRNRTQISYSEMSEQKERGI